MGKTEFDPMHSLWEKTKVDGTAAFIQQRQKIEIAVKYMLKNCIFTKYNWPLLFN